MNYVASAPLQNVTHQLRFPLVLSLVFMLVALVLEIARVTASFSRRDQEKWAAHDKAALMEGTRDRSFAGADSPNGFPGVQQVVESAASKR